LEDLEGQDMIEAKNKCVPGGTVNLIGLFRTSDWASSDVSKHIRTCSNISQKTRQVHVSEKMAVPLMTVAFPLKK